MSKTQKDGTVEQQMPGANFASGNITLFQIAESRGKNIGQNVAPNDYIISERDKEILDKAIPADRFEKVLRNVGAEVEKRKIEKGKVMLHKPTGKQVKIISLNVGMNPAKVQHLVRLIGTDKTFKVKSENLCPI